MARILVADDEQIVQDRLCGEKVTKAGHQPTAVSDGIGALAEARTGKFDVLILDCQMAQSGIQVLEDVRKDPTIDHLHVIGMTDMSKGGDIRNWVDLGADAAWEKDLSDAGLDKLLALIDEVLKSGA